MNQTQNNTSTNSRLNAFKSILSANKIDSCNIDYHILDYHLPFLERLDAIDNSSVVLFDCLTGRYRFITAKFKYLIGYDRDTALEEVKKRCGMEMHAGLYLNMDERKWYQGLMQYF